MIFANHVRLGLATWIAVGAITATPVTPTGLLLATFGALLPDIDHPRSFLGQRCPPVPWLLRQFSQHRGVTHSFFAIVTLTLALAALTYWQYGDLTPRTYWPLLAGYISGIAGDLLTAGGVQFSWPSKRWWRIPGAPASGTMFEITLCYTCLTVALFLWIDRGRPLQEWLDWFTHLRHVLYAMALLAGQHLQHWLTQA